MLYLFYYQATKVIHVKSKKINGKMKKKNKNKLVKESDSIGKGEIKDG